MEPLRKLDRQRVLEIRRRLIRMHYESGVGHIGGNLSSIDALALLFNEYIGPSDHFILSKGHSAGALYVALWSAGTPSSQPFTATKRYWQATRPQTASLRSCLRPEV
jgi:transketolase N-terminal domain/subunit